MGVTNSNKTLSVSRIDCGDNFKIKLSLTAAPDIVTNPTDIVLILDRSGSMAGSPLLNLKKGAKKFIEIIDQSTDGAGDGQIGNGSRIGIVSFSSTATQDTQLITSVTDLDAAVDAMSSGGSTNHADAFTKATELLNTGSANAKIMVMFTDGITTIGAPPAPVAAAAKAQGIIIYCIGLTGDTGLDVDTLNEWSSDPDSTFVAITPDDSELEDLFEDLAKNISKPGATDIVITDTVSPCFRVVSVDSVSKGNGSVTSDNSVKWEIDELGTTQSEGAIFEFTVEHVGSCTGNIEVNTSIDYSDNENNIVTFPSPQIEISCDEPIIGEECPEPVDVTIGNCTDTVEYDAGDLYLDSLGRILQLDVTLKNICPGKRVALAVIVNETDDKGVEYKRGMKTLVIPAHTKNTCRDVTVRCIKFVLPEALDVCGNASSICNKRKFKVRFIANYIDNDFNCCSSAIK